MNKRTFLLASAATLAASSLPALAETSLPARAEAGYAPVNGIALYYELHGAGKPLVLLHGGLGSIEMFGPVLAALAKTRQVIAVDLQGHGRTAPFDRPMTYANLAADVAELITWLGHEKADVLGYSLGGITALRLALDHPGVVDKLVLTSAPYAFAGWHDFNAQGMKGMAMAPDQAAEGMKQTPMYAAYAALQPDPEANWPKTVAQTGSLVGTEFDFSPELPALAVPTLTVVGDWDAVRITHAADFYTSLGGGAQDGGWDGSGMNAHRLAVIPGATHYTIFADRRLAELADGFLG